MMDDVSSFLQDLIAIQYRVNKLVGEFKKIKDLQDEILAASEAVQMEIATSEIDDIVSESYKKANLIQAYHEEQEFKTAERLYEPAD